MIRTAILIFFGMAAMMNAQEVLEGLKIEPHGVGRSGALPLAARSVVRIAADREGEIHPAIFIYEVEQGLVAKNDEDSDHEGFEWTVSEAGRFTVVIYSRSDRVLEYEISRFPPRPVRGPASSQSPVLATVPVFFATNRKLTSSMPVVVGADPTDGSELHLGKMEVTVPLDHRMGTLEYPSILRLEFHADPSKHFVSSPPMLVAQADFYKSIRELAARSTTRDALVFIHGYNTTFEDASLRTAQLAYDLGFQGPAVLFSWPSQGELRNYLKDGRNADLSSRPLQQLLKGLSEQGNVDRIHVIAHSMGNRVLAAALAKWDPGRTPVREIALIAPDIDSELFRQLAEQFPKGIGPIALYASSQDKALVASSKLAGYVRAGQGGKDMVVIQGIESIDASSVDTSSLGMGHQYYADSREILGDLYGFFQGRPPEKRFSLKRSQDGRYWHFAP